MAALSLVWEPDAVLVSGACPERAGDLAERCWRYWDGGIERWPAEWYRYGRSAGMRRNETMVTTGPDVCVAFVKDDLPGASHTIRMARAAGVPTYVWQHPL